MHKGAIKFCVCEIDRMWRWDGTRWDELEWCENK